ncbi:MAG: exo-beta-N-acetylmuramidase NamZ domain-containing protein [Parachlamydiaceae bacterium]
MGTHLFLHFSLVFLLFFFSFPCKIEGKVVLGVENLFTPSYSAILRGKKVGLITNHTAIDSNGASTADLFKQHAKSCDYTLLALFAPEHGLKGIQHAGESVKADRDSDGFPVYSLHGATRRPTPEMLKGVTLLVYDIQDIGSRSYTYISTLFYAMEEAAKANIPFVVVDRPNPLGGELVDGPALEDQWRSFVGYINVPYCHGLTVGELAHYFNGEYKVGCDLTVIPMRGWNRRMHFNDTGLTWIPTSPQVPDAQTAFHYPTTGLLGELQIVNIGVGYTLPFKVIGAPWINSDQFVERLNAQQFPGVRFQPFHYTPFFGRFAGEACHGALIVITDHRTYLPVTTQFLLLGILKTLYPSHFQKGIEASGQREEMFNKVNGTAEVYRILKEEGYVIWKLRNIHQKERELYLTKRKAYLHPDY